MSRTFDRATAGLMAGSLSLLLSQSAFASIVNVAVPTIHIPVSAVHVSVPAVHVSAPAIQVKTADFKTTDKTVNRSTSHRDLADGGGDRRGHGTPASIVSYRSTSLNVQSSLAQHHGGDFGGNKNRDRNSGGMATSRFVSAVTTIAPGTTGIAWHRGGNGAATIGSVNSSVTGAGSTSLKALAYAGTPVGGSSTNGANAFQAAAVANAALAALTGQLTNVMAQIQAGETAIAATIAAEQAQLQTLYAELGEAMGCATDELEQCPAESVSQIDQQIATVEANLAESEYDLALFRTATLAVAADGVSNQTVADMDAIYIYELACSTALANGESCDGIVAVLGTVLKGINWEQVLALTALISNPPNG